MTTTLNQTVARAHAEELIREADRHRLALHSTFEPVWSRLVIRLATAGDQRALERLAELDSRRAPAGTTLIAELAGRPVAAVSLGDGEQIADPFIPTSDITELLRLRARQLSAPAHAHRWSLRPPAPRLRPGMAR
ncbi:MAG TPA: hypothetical protein VGF70_04715 [Solirubrobacteraceae bacterium]|jgi:hypothetical protein